MLGELLQVYLIVIVCHAIATDGGVGGVLDYGPCFDRSVALTFEGLIRAHFMLVGSGCIHPYMWLSPLHGSCTSLARGIVCHGIATNGGVGGIVDHGLGLGWLHVSVAVSAWLVDGLEAIVFGSIRWCVWSVRPSSLLRSSQLESLLC